MPKAAPPIGIIAAMPGEIAALDAEIRAGGAAPVVTHARGNRDYHRGTIAGRDVVLVMSRVGKVAAATTATSLIHDHDPSEIIFTGVAGGLARGVRIGDAVIATECLQHDLDARPLFPQHEIPLLGIARIAADAQRTDCAATAADRALATRDATVHVGLIASGDQFIASRHQRNAILDAVPDALAVEMEGAAVAQVCHEHAVPWTIARLISDAADDHAAAHFEISIEQAAAQFTRDFVHNLLATG